MSPRRWQARVASYPMGSYSFFSLWELHAPIDEVWSIISKSDEYPIWWRYVESTTRVSEGDDDGVGQTVRSKWSTALPYGFEFEMEATRVVEPTLLEVASRGELEGTGTWELSTIPEGTAVRYYWRVRTTRWWMDLLGPIARPAFAWNHALIMRSGGEGLANRLSASLVRNESYTGEGSSPVHASLTIAAIVVAGFWLPAAVLRRILRAS